MKKHFENIWEEAEEQSFKSNTSILATIEELKKLLDSYYKYVVNSSQIDSSLLFKLKAKKLGEILFLIANISKLESQNVYACLVNIIQANKIKEIEENEEDIY